MRVKHQRVIYEDIVLSDKEVIEVTKNKLYSLLDGGEYLREGKKDGKTITYLKQDDPDHRHGSISEVIVREATNLDIAIIKVLEVLK
jgi:hypothetical protein